jgi:prepilin-type N-terminal cleavage/methylation domain-containing protein
MLIVDREAGFTLIELVVAMFIGLIVIGLFVAAISQAWVRRSDSDSHALASARISEALDRISDDVRAARKPERSDIFRTATKDELRVQLTSDPVLYGDVAAAEGRRLALYTNGDGGANPMCVTWSYQQVDDGRSAQVWALTRRIDANCTPAPNEGREIIAALPEGMAPPLNTFRYGVLGNPNGIGECPVNVASPGAGNLGAAQRLRIVAVHVDLSTGSARGSIDARRRVGRDVIGLWSRLNNDYYFALDCAQ